MMRWHDVPRERRGYTRLAFMVGCGSFRATRWDERVWPNIKFVADQKHLASDKERSFAVSPNPERDKGRLAPEVTIDI
jgi:hypothetical protein